MSKQEYKNLIAFHPGYYLTDILDELEMTQEDFAIRLGTTPKTISKLLNGKTPLTNDLAKKLSSMLGISVGTLLNLQKAYDEKLIEIEQLKEMDVQIEIADNIDYSYFVKNNFLPKVAHKVEKVKTLCAFLRVGNLQILKRPDLLASFRTTIADVSDKNIINANVWLQTAINKGLEISVEPFDEKKLKSYIPEIRSMTLQTPDEFLPRLNHIFRECGVAFVLLPALKNCGVNGVVRWYDDKVILAINDRYKYADTFWFSLFHEIKHVFQQKKTRTIVNCKDDSLGFDDSFELEADDFARETLIPEKEYSRFVAMTGRYISKSDVIHFANRIGIHPGIVVGRLQHDKRLDHSSMFEFKQRYTIIM